MSEGNETNEKGGIMKLYIKKDVIICKVIVALLMVSAILLAYLCQ